MRLMLVAESSTVHTHKWARHFQRKGADVLVVSQTPQPVEGVRVVQFPPATAWWTRLPSERFGGGWQRWLAGWPAWRRLIRDYQPDIIHIYYIAPQARVFFYYRHFTNLVVSTHGADVVFEPDQPPSSSTVRRIRTLLKQAKLITATSEFLAAETREYVEERRTVEVIPFGVDCEVFSPASTAPRDESRPLVLGFLKHLEVKYGPDVLLEAFALLQEEVPGLRLILAGQGSLASELQARARHLGIASQVSFPGWIPHHEVPELLRTFDIFVMPSVFQSETFGVAALEASACGLPVVASRVGGIPETVAHGETGLLVSPGDPHELAQACLTLLSQPELRHQLGHQGRQFVQERYEWNRTAAKMERLYETMLAE